MWECNVCLLSPLLREITYKGFICQRMYGCFIPIVGKKGAHSGLQTSIYILETVNGQGQNSEISHV